MGFLTFLSDHWSLFTVARMNSTVFGKCLSGWLFQYLIHLWALSDQCRHFRLRGKSEWIQLWQGLSQLIALLSSLWSTGSPFVSIVQVFFSDVCHERKPIKGKGRNSKLQRCMIQVYHSAQENISIHQKHL